MLPAGLKGVRRVFVVTVKNADKISASHAYAGVDSNMFAAVGLMNVGNGKSSLRRQVIYDRPGIIGRSIIDDHPFEIVQRLRFEARINLLQEMRPIIRWRHD